MAGDIKIEFENEIAVLTLRNPGRLNAISASMWNALTDFAASVSRRQDIRAIVIRGEGESAFSSGADVTEFSDARSDAQRAQGYDDLVEGACCAIEALPQPTIALIKGACVGAGASLAFSCDLRLAAQDAFFAVPAAKLGLGYDPRGIARLVRAFGVNAARQILFTAERVPATRAFALGAIHDLAPAQEVDVLAKGLAERVAAKAPLTIRAAKLAVRALVSGAVELQREAAELYRAADASRDYAEGRQAFTEKRSPRFTGA